MNAVQRMLGHASAAMTLDVYADLLEDDLEAVARTMSAARSAAACSSPDARPFNALAQVGMRGGC